MEFVKGGDSQIKQLSEWASGLIKSIATMRETENANLWASGEDLGPFIRDWLGPDKGYVSPPSGCQSSPKHLCGLSKRVGQITLEGPRRKILLLPPVLDPVEDSGATLET